MVIINKFGAHYCRDDDDHRSNQLLSFAQYQSRAHPRSEKLSDQHDKTGGPNHFPADDKQQQAANIGGGIEHFRVGRRFGEVIAAQHDK